ncbi:MAG: polysaccharide pyruvyl transferase family protein [Clostridia bacterium]|nr:polysaccharide pyruvyl transferase family protein [Clostridia bacterium]
MKYFLFDHTGSLNRGCEAIVRGTKNIISRNDKNPLFHLASYSPETDAALRIETSAIKPRALSGVEKIFAAIDLKINHSEYFSLKTAYSDVIQRAGDCDICLSVGGDTYCYGDNAPSRAIAKALHKNGKKTVLWGASIGKEDLSAEKIETLKMFDGIFVRESLTYALLEKIIPREKLFQFADPAFCMEREDLPLPQGFEQDNTLGFNLSPLVVKKNPELIDACVDFLKGIIQNTTLQIALVPHVTTPDSDDTTVLDEIYNRLNDSARVVKIPGNLNAMQYKGYIARCRFFIGARTHATIAAYSNGVPTIVLGYSVKSRGIAKDLFSEEKFVLDINTVSGTQALNSEFSKLLEQESDLRKTLRKVIPMTVKSAMDAGEQLMKI